MNLQNRTQNRLLWTNNSHIKSSPLQRLPRTSPLDAKKPRVELTRPQRAWRRQTASASASAILQPSQLRLQVGNSQLCVLEYGLGVVHALAESAGREEADYPVSGSPSSLSLFALVVLFLGWYEKCCSLQRRSWDGAVLVSGPGRLAMSFVDRKCSGILDKHLGLWSPFDIGPVYRVRTLS